MCSDGFPGFRGNMDIDICFLRQNIVTFEVYVPFFSFSFLKLLSVTCHIYKTRYHLHRGIVTSSNSQWEKFTGRKSSDKNIELRLLG